MFHLPPALPETFCTYFLSPMATLMPAVSLAHEGGGQYVGKVMSEIWHSVSWQLKLFFLVSDHSCLIDLGSR